MLVGNFERMRGVWSFVVVLMLATLFIYTMLAKSLRDLTTPERAMVTSSTWRRAHIGVKTVNDMCVEPGPRSTLLLGQGFDQVTPFPNAQDHIWQTVSIE